MTATWQEKKNISIFAARNIDEETRLLSSSGGVFSLFAEMILKKGGIVCGAAFDERFDVHHCFAHDTKGLASLRKSKYVKSKIGSAYQEVKMRLEEGVYVLFSGTPCETAGLKTYLGKKYERLFCIDVICHGAPDPRVWRGYLNALELKYGAAVSCVEFRKKNYSSGHGEQPGPHNVYMKIGKTEICGKDVYMQGFLGGLFLLPCCHRCRFKGFTSGADIQLGDFWGLHTIYPEFCERTEDGTPISDGTSEVIVLTDKGKSAFEEIRSQAICFEVNQKRFEYHKGFGNYDNLYKSIDPHKNRESFFAAIKDAKTVPPELILEYLEKDAKKKNRYVFGLIGSLHARQIFRTALYADQFDLRFHFSGSNVISLLSKPAIPPMELAVYNPIQRQMVHDDFTKEFAVNFQEYAQETRFLAIELLNERFIPIIMKGTDGTDTYVTKSGIFQRAALRGIPLDTEDFPLWCEKALEWIALIKTGFAPENVFLLETTLAPQYSDIEGSIPFDSTFMIREINNDLRRKYNFIRNHFDGIHLLRSDLYCQYAEPFQEYGLDPACHESALYNFYAKSIAAIIASQKSLQENTTGKIESLHSKRTDVFADDGVNITDIAGSMRTARVQRFKCNVMRDWLFKETLNADFGRALKKWFEEKGCKYISVYDMKFLGQVFMWKLANIGIPVKCAIDSKPGEVFSSVPIFTPDQAELSTDDLVVYCGAGAAEAAKASLAKGVGCTVIALRQVIFECN